MGRKKHLQNISKEDMEYIDSKMSGNKDYELVGDYKRHLKSLSFKLDIKCKNEKQKEFLNNLKNDEKSICFGIGSAGTGKSFLSLSYGLSKLKDSAFEHIIMVVPTAQAVNKDMSLGFLKGDFYEKTQMFKESDKSTIEKILKLSGNNGFKTISEMLMNSGLIQYEFVNFMLGKTFDNSLILVNEAEQYTKDDMKLILTRLGENSKIVITGDTEQINRDSIVKNKNICGLSYCAARLKDMEATAITEFHREDIVRNPLITEILNRLD